MNRKLIGLIFSVFSIPVVEVYCLHRMVHAVLGPNNTVIGIYSRDIYLPVLLGAILAMAKMHARRPFEFRLQPNTIAVNLTTLVFLSLALLHHDWLALTIGSEAVVTLLILGAMLMAVSGLTVFTPFPDLLDRVRSFGSRLWYLVGALGLLFTYPYVLAAVWPWLVKVTGFSVLMALRALGLGVTRFDVAQNIGIHHPLLRASIGMGCSGLEGIFFFLFAYLLVRLFAGRRASWFRTVAVVSGGICFMFVLNVFRIVLFFGVAVLINQHSTLPYGRAFFVWAFHQNIGWILYFFGIAAFLNVFGRYFTDALAGAETAEAASQSPS